MRIEAELYIRGTKINKVDFSDMLEEIEFGNNEFLQQNSNKLFDLMADENEKVYFSDGFKLGLYAEFEEVEEDEWHHFFKKNEDGIFESFKLPFKNNTHYVKL